MKGQKSKIQNDQQLNKELRIFLENSNALDTEEIEELLKKELEYRLISKEILDIELFRERSLHMESRESFHILQTFVFGINPDRKDYS